MFETPIILQSANLEITENRPAGDIITSNILASDEDTNPNLTFSIDWSKSSAMKNSVPIKAEDFDRYQYLIFYYFFKPFFDNFSFQLYRREDNYSR